MKSVSIRKLTEPDWPLLREIRLRALATDPGVFGSNHAKESLMTEGDWRGWLTSPDNAIFGLFDGDRIVGMTAIAIDKGDPAKKSAVLWGSWLAAEWRGQGLSQIMYEARLGWAREHAICEKIVVSHRASNEASRGANQKHGFTFTHSAPQAWPDGVTEDRLFYALTVKPS